MSMKFVSGLVFILWCSNLYAYNFQALDYDPHSDFFGIKERYFHPQFHDRRDPAMNLKNFIGTNELPQQSQLRDFARGVLYVKVPSPKGQKAVLNPVGTMFCLKHGLILTNYHVLKIGQNRLSYKPVIQLQGESQIRQLDIVMQSNEAEFDFILAKIPAGESYCRGRELTLDFRPMQPGEKLATIGFPTIGGGTQTISFGVMTAKHISGFTSNVLVFQGSSGGPIIEKSGKVIGLIHSRHPERGDRSFGSTLHDIEKKYALSTMITEHSLKHIDMLLDQIEMTTMHNQAMMLLLLEEYQRLKTVYGINRLIELLKKQSPVSHKIVDILLATEALPGDVESGVAFEQHASHPLIDFHEVFIKKLRVLVKTIHENRYYSNEVMCLKNGLIFGRYNDLKVGANQSTTNLSFYKIGQLKEQSAVPIFLSQKNDYILAKLNESYRGNLCEYDYPKSIVEKRPELIHGDASEMTTNDKIVYHSLFERMRKNSPYHLIESDPELSRLKNIVQKLKDPNLSQNELLAILTETESHKSHYLNDQLFFWLKRQSPINAKILEILDVGPNVL